MHPYLSHILVAASSWTTSGEKHMRRDTGFEVTSPETGQTITLPEYGFDDKLIPIRWTVPAALEDRPVIISLVQGSNPDNLTTIETVASGAKNNGTLDWISSIGYDATSGCNYSIYLKVWTDFAYSGYFTLINPDDTGISTDEKCPVDNGLQRPANGSLMTSGDELVQQDSSTRGPDGSGGVSTTTLAIAVAIPIIVLLLLFAIVLYLGVRKGWFVRKDDRDALSRYREAYGNDFTQQTKGGVEIGTKERNMGELSGDHGAHQLNSTEVYQLHGDALRR